MSFLIAAVGAYTVSRLGEQGLADFCGLKTLRYGTDPLSWVRVHLMGVTPEQDFSAGGPLKGSNHPLRINK